MHRTPLLQMRTSLRALQLGIHTLRISNSSLLCGRTSRINYKGKIQYYFFGRRFGHSGVCFRFHDSDTPATAKLIIDKFQGEDKWFIRVKTTEWRPRSENEVEISKHDWHVGAMLHVAHRFSQGKFRNYHKLFNNCNRWKKEVVDYMREKGPLMDLSQLDVMIRQLLKEGVVLDLHH